MNENEKAPVESQKQEIFTLVCSITNAYLKEAGFDFERNLLNFIVPQAKWDLTEQGIEFNKLEVQYPIRFEPDKDQDAMKFSIDFKVSL